MAEKNIVSKPPLQVKLTDPNGLMNRAWSTWFRDLYNRVAYKGGNAIDENNEQINESLDSTNSTLEQTIEAVNQNKSDINQNKENLTLHEELEEAHASNGKIVGFNDLAEESVVGLVARMALIANAVETTVDITTADIGAAPAAYDQAYTQLVTDLTNENKAAINQLASDLNDAIAVLNNLLAESKTSGQMTN